jgi:hypothetical protein
MVVELVGVEEESDVARQKVRYRYLSQCGSVALGIQHATLMRHIVICGLQRYTIFLTLSHKKQYLKKTKVIKHKMCV